MRFAPNRLALLVLALGLGGVFAAEAQPVVRARTTKVTAPPASPFEAAKRGAPVGVGPAKAYDPRSLGASATGGTVTVVWTDVDVSNDGSMFFNLVYTNAGGNQLHIRHLKLDPGCTQVVDNFGTLVYTTTGPTDALCTTQSGFVSRINTLINAGAAGGKLNL